MARSMIWSLLVAAALLLGFAGASKDEATCTTHSDCGESYAGQCVNVSATGDPNKCFCADKYASCGSKHASG